MTEPTPPPSASPPSPPMGQEEFELEADRWRKGPSSVRRLARRIAPNWSLVLGLSLMSGFLFLGIVAVIHFWDQLQVIPTNFEYAQQYPPPGPSYAHPFGIMHATGADILTNVIQATPIDLALVGGPILIALSIGSVLGGITGLFRGYTDYVVTGFTDVVISVPPFFLVLVLFLGIRRLIPPDDSLVAFGLLFAFVLWPYYARPVRARARQVGRELYVDASRASGASSGRLLFRHVLPNSFSPVLAQVPVDVYNIFFVLTAFVFIGCFGNSGGGGGFFAILSPMSEPLSYPEWGALLATGACGGWSPLAGSNFWWMYTFPALAIFAFGASVAVLCDGFERFLRVRRAA